MYDSEGAWIEDYTEGGSFDEHDTDLGVWALDLVKRFNETRRPNERERFLSKVTVEETGMNLKSGLKLIDELIDQITKEDDDDLVIELLQEMSTRASDAESARQEEIDKGEQEEDDLDEVEEEEDGDDKDEDE